MPRRFTTCSTVEQFAVVSMIAATRIADAQKPSKSLKIRKKALQNCTFFVLLSQKSL
jgi:hypothetical protein